ncbi:MAG: glycosyltransferase family 4 protein [Anaerolineaceae bacterium]|nr:glycosyltransferase family 4 protein [Anaerolineaceae bacterium]
MKVLLSSTYFHPYSSGLSVYALRLANGLADLGHEVVVLTSQYKKDLPTEEIFNKIKIVRVPVLTRLSKGVIMPAFLRTARRWVKWADVVNLHLPQFESVLLSKQALKLAKPILVTYHCDLVMSGGLLSQLAGKVTTALGKQVLEDAALIVQNSLDYAENSETLQPFLEKVVESPTPVVVKEVSPERAEQFRAKYDIKKNSKVIGLAGRVATEKGFEYLAMALPEILEKFPEATVIHAGAWKSVVGEETYQATLKNHLKPFGQTWRLLGFLSDEEFEAFFAVCDLLVFSSLNATESYGIVQIEAMTQGTPVVASDLPGVRQPVLKTGLGKIIPLRDPKAIADAVIEILKKGEQARFIPKEFLADFQQDAVAARYEAWMEAVLDA